MHTIAIQENLDKGRLQPACAYAQNFIAERASGSYIYSTDGQKHLDMAAGTKARQQWSCFVSTCHAGESAIIKQFALHNCTYNCMQASEWSQQATATPRWSRPSRTRQLH